MIYSDFTNLYIFMQKIPVTCGLIFLNIAIMLVLLTQSGHFYQVPDNVLEYYGAVLPHGELWRAFTCMFLHMTLFHLFANMSCIAFYAMLEKNIGSLNFLVIYLFSGLMTGLAIIYLGTDSAVGASGAISGLIGFHLFLALGSKKYKYMTYKNNYYRDEFKSSAVQNTISLILIGFFANVSNLGHAAGFIAGFLTGTGLGLVSLIKNCFNRKIIVSSTKKSLIITNH